MICVHDFAQIPSAVMVSLMLIARPQGIMLQILLIMLFRISLKIPHYAYYYSFYAFHYYYSIAPIADNIMHKCCDVKL